MLFVTRINYYLITCLCLAVGLLPAWILYGPVLYMVYFVLYRVVGYRRKMVRGNLSRSFPEKSREELRRIEKGFYRNLAGIFIDTLDLAGISKRELDKRICFKNVERHTRELKGRDWIAALAHYGSWEYFMAYQLHTDSRVLGVYHPLHNKAFDNFFIRSRRRFGLEPVPMKETLRTLLEYRRRGEPFNLGLIADQSPKVTDKQYIFDFFSQPTAFMVGIEKLAVRLGLPVYFMEVQKKGKVKYEASFVMIYDGTEQLPEGEITRRYISRLEQMIRRDPALWMWSHNRWKKLKTTS